jgi:hypothetical protein
VVFKLQEFFKQLEFRISEHQLEYISRIFHEYILYTIEYVLYWNYHNKGANPKVFYLGIKDEGLLEKTKEFNFLEIEVIKKRNILEMSKLTRCGFLKLIFEIYFISEIFRLVSKSQSIDSEQFMLRLSKIMAKDQSKEAVDASKRQFAEALGKMARVFRDRP